MHHRAASIMHIGEELDSFIIESLDIELQGSSAATQISDNMTDLLLSNGEVKFERGQK